LLAVIDECLAQAEPQRRHTATLAAVADAVDRTKSAAANHDASAETSRAGGRP
jgi:hypothetical protein